MKRKYVRGLGERKEFKNVGIEKKFDSFKKYYGTVTTDKSSFLLLYETDLRSDAVSVFEKEAKMLNGKLDDYIGTL